jgi:topoisomerase-4 subunit A
MATSIPPHNAAELCDAALHLIKTPNATDEKIAQLVQGPDFATGGIVVDSRESIIETYATGRGSFRIRSRWVKEEGARGAWNAVVTEIPYGVQKSRLIEKLAELVNEKKMPLLADVRDESAEDVRIVLEPRARNVDPQVMMESLFRMSELEARFAMNMNVLVDGVTPRVLSLPEALRQWLDHRREVLLRRSRHRLAEIERRLEVLAGMIIAFLNLDEVIRIIREEDEPKDVLKATFDLTDIQANYILDTRLRSLRRLEEMQLRGEHAELTREKGELETLVGEEPRQWRAITAQIREMKKKWGPLTALGKRRTTFEAPPAVSENFDLTDVLVEREPITVVVTQKGWIRALKGQVSDLANLQYKGDDALQVSFFAETTSKIMVLASDGKIFTLEASKLPGGRGAGEPIRLLADMDDGEDVAAVFVHRPGGRMLVASSDGRGFVANENDMIANTRKGKMLLNLDAGAKARFIAPVEGDTVAAIGENRKLLCFALTEIPEMTRGKGVRLQRYKDGGLSDIKTFALDAGLSWVDTSGRTYNVAKEALAEWLGTRADAGRLPPKNFPRNNKFG